MEFLFKITFFIFYYYDWSFIWKLLRFVWLKYNNKIVK